jgi:hypothetical protein
MKKNLRQVGYLQGFFQLLRITARNPKTFQLLHIVVKRVLILVTSKEFLALTE